MDNNNNNNMRSSIDIWKDLFSSYSNTIKDMSLSVSKSIPNVLPSYTSGASSINPNHPSLANSSNNNQNPYTYHKEEHNYKMNPNNYNYGVMSSTYKDDKAYMDTSTVVGSNKVVSSYYFPIVYLPLFPLGLFIRSPFIKK